MHDPKRPVGDFEHVCNRLAHWAERLTAPVAAIFEAHTEPMSDVSAMIHRPARTQPWR